MIIRVVSRQDAMTDLCGIMFLIRQDGNNESRISCAREVLWNILKILRRKNVDIEVELAASNFGSAFDSDFSVGFRSYSKKSLQVIAIRS